nr:unnamed protein product [Callosobruchus analis]
MRGSRVYIPPSLWKNVLSELHVGHFGTTCTQLWNPVSVTRISKYLQSYGIHYKFTAPYHPATNGQAELYVETLKKSLKVMLYDNNETNMMQKVNLLLMQYRKMPSDTTSKSPSPLMFGREIKTKPDKIIPVERLTLTDESAETKSGNNCTRQFSVGARVAARNYQGDKWLFRKVHEVLGALHYLILFDKGKSIKRHVDQIQLEKIFKKTN